MIRALGVTRSFCNDWRLSDVQIYIDIFRRFLSISSFLFLSSLAEVDEAESECGLDTGVTFDWIISNDGDQSALEEQLRQLTAFIRSKLTAEV